MFILLKMVFNGKPLSSSMLITNSRFSYKILDGRQAIYSANFVTENDKSNKINIYPRISTRESFLLEPVNNQFVTRSY